MNSDLLGAALNDTHTLGISRMTSDVGLHYEIHAIAKQGTSKAVRSERGNGKGSQLGVRPVQVDRRILTRCSTREELAPHFVVLH